MPTKTMRTCQPNEPAQSPRASLRADIADDIDDVRQLTAKADALAQASRDLFDAVLWTADGNDTRRRERFAHLLSATGEAIEAAIDAGRRLAAKISSRDAEA